MKATSADLVHSSGAETAGKQNLKIDYRATISTKNLS